MLICADDYGLSDDINRAVCELCQQGKLTAVSCLVALARCTPEALRELRPHRPNVDLGLHLCLTDEKLPLSRPATGPTGMRAYASFGALLRAALSGKVRPEDIAELTAAQYRLFVDKCGCPPDYIDGHLHAHQLPGVRQGLLQFIQTLPAGSRLYVRNTYLPLRLLRRQRLPLGKAVMIGWFGRRLLAELARAGVPTNTGFSGIYDFAQSRKYCGYLPRFLACLGHPNGLLVTHPGEIDPWRREEFAALRRQEFQPGALNRFQFTAPAPPGQSLP